MAGADSNPLANVGSSPLERIYQLLIIQNYILKTAFGIDVDDYMWINSGVTGPVNPNVSPNFTEPL